MNEITLDEILVMAHDIEFSQYDHAPEHVFSRKHNRAMKRIFKAYARKTALLRSDITDQKSEIPHFRWNRKTIIAVLVIIFLAALAGCTAVLHYFGGFRTDVYTDNTQLFSIDVTDCPQSIEKVYYLSELPDDFELREEIISDIDVYTSYINNATRQTIVFHQSIKTAFEPHYNTEYFDLEEISVGEHKGIGLEGKTDYAVAWDNGDYILEVWADLPKSDTINLAKSAKVLEN
ncbi:MAG: DUF4367 domain-containing protein [Firmicutes bacterium]|nr:DUF4367 domain-containing protein [[Eubacterium] siraeum]MCM1487447.1 DUF4367 domain-containing protein [Bacillota bacterium]